MRKLLLPSALVWASLIHPAQAAIQYAGGTNVNSQCTASAGTKQELSDCIEDALNTAGWTTISGHHTSTVLVESLITPTAGLQMRMQMTQGTNCVVLKGRNVANTKAATNGNFLLPGVGKVFRVIADKYQYFIATDGTSAARSVASGGVLYVPSFLGTTEAIWTMGNAYSDTDATNEGSFKAFMGYTPTGCNGMPSNAGPGTWVTYNGTQWETTSGQNAGQGRGMPRFVLPTGSSQEIASEDWPWADGSISITEPQLSLGLVSPNAVPVIVGQFWDAALFTKGVASEVSYAFDSKNWLSWTNGANTSNGNCRSGTLVLVVP